MKSKNKKLIVLMVAVLLLAVLPVFEHEHVHALSYGDPYGICPNCGVRTAYIEVVYEQPTCIGTGSGTIYCACGIENYPVVFDPLGHDHQYSYMVQAATCESGGIARYACIRCGDSYDTATAALGHDYHDSVTKEPTCQEEGINTFTCSRCSDHYDEAIEPLGHDFIHEEKEATCTEEGHIGDICSRCGKEQSETIPPLGHNYSQSWTIKVKPTYFKRGLKIKTCSRCGDVLSESIPALIPIPAVIGGIGGLILLGIGIAAVIKRKAASAAAKAGVVAAEKLAKEASKLGKPKFKTRTLLLCTKDEKLVEMLKGKDYFKVKTCSYDELTDKAKDVEPDILIADVLNDVMLREISEGQEEAFKEIALGLIACKDLSETGREKLKVMANEEKIIDFVEEGVNPYVAMVELILPVLKPDLKSDETLTNIGMVADALGIPGISKIIDVYLAGKDIKETLEEEELGISEDATIIGDIASILGLEKVESVAGLVGDVEAIQKALDKETGAYEEKKGKAAVKDIVEVVSDLADD